MKLLSLCGFAALLTGMLAAQEAPRIKKDAPRPNILFIITDDHAVQSMGTCDADSPVPLPAFRKLADEGMVFDRSYCTNSICGPSRASMMSGRHSHRNGFIYNYGGPEFDGTQPTFSKMLQEAGYQTGLIGKWHLKSNPTGFDTWQVFNDQGEYWNPNFKSSNGKGGTKQTQARGYVTDVVTNKAIDWMERRDKERPFALVVGQKAPHRNWIPAPRHLRKIKELVAKMTPPATLHDDWSNRPAFLRENRQSVTWDLCNWNDNHLIQEEIPFDVMKEIIPKNKLREMMEAGRFEGEIPADFDLAKHQPKFPAKNNYSFSAKGNSEEGTHEIYATFYGERTHEFVQDMRAGKIQTVEDMTLRRWRWYMEDYLGTVLAVDESIATLMSYLDNEGLSENTLVVYVGDQGFYLGEHNLYDKRWIFEESFRMPLIMRWKGQITPKVRSTAMVQNIDYAPTFVELAGVDTKKNMSTFDGYSLTPLFKTGKAKPFMNRSLYYAFYEQPAEHNAPRHDGFRTPRYTFSRIWTHGPGEKLGEARKVEDEWMLIDNEKDPLQLKNVVNDPAYAETFKQMKAEYEKLRRDFKVPDNSPGFERNIPNFKADWSPTIHR